jgi:phenylacetic acid degradation operon negative regulatory protein
MTPKRLSCNSVLCHLRWGVRAVASALRAFRQRRPLRGGSLLVTLFGDAVAPHGGALALGSLIALAAPFGLTERLVRTSASRLTHDGWFHTRRIGRISVYRLTPVGKARSADAALRIYEPPPELPHRTWTMVLMPAGLTIRDTPARELQWLGFGRMSPEVFVHPTCTPREVTGHLQLLGLSAGAVVVQAALQSRADEQQLVQASWNLADFSERYERLLRTFGPIDEALAQGQALSPADSFVVRTLLVHEYRRIVLRDPRLPTALLPDDWAGGRAYTLCQSLYARVFAASETHLHSVVSDATGSAGAWHALDASALGRFGGVLPQELLEREVVAATAPHATPRRRSRGTQPRAPRSPEGSAGSRPMGACAPRSSRRATRDR